MALLLLVCLASSVSAVGPWADEFPAYPGARSLGFQHIASASGHIMWSAYSSPDEPAKVRDYYGKHYVEEGSGDGQHFTFKVGKKHLSIYPAASKAYPLLEQKPQPEDRSVIIVSQLISGD